MSKFYTGAEIVFKCLEDQDVEYIFGYPGGAALHIYDSIFKQIFCEAVGRVYEGPLPRCMFLKHVRWNWFAF